MGGFMPINENALSDFAMTPDAQGMLLQFNSIEFSPLLLKDAQSKCEKYAKSLYGNASKLSYISK